MANEDNIDDVVNQLVDQLQSNTKVVNKVVKAEPSVTKDNLEEFLINSSSQLIKNSIEFVDDLKSYISSAPESKDVEAMAALVASSASAIESLNKILISNKNIDIKIKLKTMDIENKQQMQHLDMQGKLLMNREELLKKLIDEAKIVDVELTSKDL